MSTTLEDLIREACARYGFRGCGPFEGREAYRAALVAFVEAHDRGFAYELRLGRRQADWTPAEVEAYRTHLLNDWRGPRTEPAPGQIIGAPMLDGGHHPVNEASLLQITDDGLRWFCDERRADPTKDLVIVANVLLATGQLWVAMPPRAGRIALLRTLAQSMPVFGFSILFDAFVHSVPAAGYTGPATKEDAILAHVGTRDLRRMITHRYRVVDGRVVFAERQVIDKRGLETVEDPYAGIFATAAVTDRPQ